MTLEDQIQKLLAEAAPLRLLDDDDPAKTPLTGIIDEVNKMRAQQAADVLAAEIAPAVEGADAEPVKRGPGRPKKAE